MIEPMSITERLYTPRELAEIASCSPATIKREVQRGRLRGLRIGAGRLVRIPESAWREYVSETRGSSLPAAAAHEAEK